MAKLKAKTGVKARAPGKVTVGKPTRMRVSRSSIQRKVRIKSYQGKKPRLTPKQKEWGRKFSKTSKRAYRFQKKIKPALIKRHGQVYPEVHTKKRKSKGKRIDWVTRGRRPISVKWTRWDRVQPATLKRYVYEASRYPGRRIHSRNVPKRLQGQLATGKPVLAVPHLSLKAPQKTRQRLKQFKQMAKQKGVTVELY